METNTQIPGSAAGDRKNRVWLPLICLAVFFLIIEAVDIHDVKDLSVPASFGLIIVVAVNFALLLYAVRHSKQTARITKVLLWLLFAAQSLVVMGAAWVIGTFIYMLIVFFFWGHA